MTNSRAWALLTVQQDDLQYGGNAGYEDDPSAVYRYDSEVGNYKQLSTGDAIVLRTKTRVLGIAQVQQISTLQHSEKLRQRCPNCNATALKARRSISPKWRCQKCGGEFDSPVVEKLEVTAYEARYAHTYLSLNDAISLNQLKSIVLRPSDQMSIAELDLGKLEELLGSDDPMISDIFRRLAWSVSLDPLEAVPDDLLLDAPRPDSYQGSVTDSRSAVLYSIRARRGQAKFRNGLIKRYGARCMVSGCEFLQLVEAAHIDPYRGTANNHLENGILLRTDLHTLFDLGLFAIDPKNLTVHFHRDALSIADYGSLATGRLLIDAHYPSTDALARRWAAFCAANPRTFTPSDSHAHVQVPT